MLAVILVAAFLAVSITSGGKRFRWFGRTMQAESFKAGLSADKVKRTADGIETGVKDVFRKGEGFIRRIRGKRG
ncbi:MAG: hypothetical protein M0Z58_04905 [Nitrospiraceae bacterium]|nr:hypothetical protein [Nitrospiraceae bacterium]